MRGWKQRDMFLAGQESRDWFDFIFDVGIRGVYLYLTLGTAKFKQLDVPWHYMFFGTFCLQFMYISFRILLFSTMQYTTTKALQSMPVLNVCIGFSNSQLFLVIVRENPK